MATSSQNLSKAIQGLWRDRSNDMDQLPKALAFSPVNPMLGNGEYQIMADDLRLDERDDIQGAAIGDNAQYGAGDFGYSSVAVQTQRHASLLYKLPEAVIQAIQGENGFVRVAEDAMKATSNQILDRYTGEWLTAAGAGLAAPAGGTLDLSDLTTDVTAYFDAAIDEIQKGSAKRPTHLIMGAEAFRAFRNMDTIQGSTALGGAASGGSFRRTGYTPLSAVAEYFQAAFGLEILVEDRTKVNSAGNGAYTLSTSMVLGYAGDPRSSCITTFAKSADFIQYDVRDLAMPDPVGIGCAANAYFKVEVTNPAAGRIITVSLP
jgi:hypothetical protein